MEASALNVEQSSSPKTFDSSVALSPGIHSITYKVTSKNGVGKPVQCSHKVTVALHTCARLDFAENIYLGPIKDKIQTHFIGCLKADSVTHENTQASEKVSFNECCFLVFIKQYSGCLQVWNNHHIEVCQR